MPKLTALVTGAAGFVGRHLSRRLCEEGGMYVVGVDKQPPPCIPDLWDDFLCADVRDWAAVRQAIRSTQPHWTFHLAGAADGLPGDIEETNVRGTLNVLEAVRERGGGASVLLVGSAAEYGPVTPQALPLTEAHPCRPVGAYGVSKHAAVKLGIDFGLRNGLRVTIARPFNIVGAGVPESMVVGALLSRVLEVLDGKQGTLRVGNLDTERDFVAVDDVVDGFVRMMRHRCWGEILNLCSGRPSTIRSIVGTVLRISGCRASLEIDPALVREADAPVVYGSWEKARRLVGFIPRVGTEEALRSAWAAAVANRRPS